jgi:hypothetical protein
MSSSVTMGTEPAKKQSRRAEGPGGNEVGELVGADGAAGVDVWSHGHAEDGDPRWRPQRGGDGDGGGVLHFSRLRVLADKEAA